MFISAESQFRERRAGVPGGKGSRGGRDMFQNTSGSRGLDADDVGGPSSCADSPPQMFRLQIGRLFQNHQKRRLSDRFES